MTRSTPPIAHSKAPALSRGLEILEFLAGEEGGATLALLKRELKIPGPSLWRLLTVLKEGGYVIYDSDAHSYRLGYRFLHMGSVLLHRVGFRSEARAYLKKLVSLTGETAELSTRIKDELILIDQEESPEPVRLFSRIGSSYPYFHATAPGKVYLAHMTEGKLQQVIEKIGLPSITRCTRGDFDVLKKELKRIRSQGYAMDNQEMRQGVFRIASPVFDQEGTIVACLGVAGPSFRLNKEKQKSLGATVREVAEELSREVTRR